MCGLRKKSKRLDFLRHTFATLMLQAGAHPKIVSEALGHSSIGITLDIYSHVLPNLQSEAAKKLETSLFGKQKEDPDRVEESFPEYAVSKKDDTGSSLGDLPYQVLAEYVPLDQNMSI